MTEDYIQQRVKEIYNAYEKHGKTADYKITLTPVNGSGDVHAKLVRGTKIKETLTKEIVIKKGDNLEEITQKA